MNGPQLRTWRKAADLSLRQLADDTLGGQVTYSTIGRWEQSPDEIPEWVTEKLLGETQIQLSLTELHKLLDLARENQMDFNEILTVAVRDYLRAKSGLNIRTPIASTSSPCPRLERVAEDETSYKT
jgi:hypothetical protein